ncbi:MAG: Stp1/IreP family PP2C-type Ser/Thr phosphatase [Acidobacteria bacterium]|nr:Stp1/IreP family PP2C-type Ser/Thr phosphatase [Acidobacteriota bacterium]
MGPKVYKRGSLQYAYQARSDVGQVRSNNEDSLIEAPDMGLFGVCDGLGGHVAGEIASSIAAVTLKEAVKTESEFPDKALRAGIRDANRRILRDQSENPEHRGMGTTVTSLWLMPEESGRGWIGHVGDSRMYLQRDDVLEQVTDDHSPVFRLYQQGVLTKDQMQHHPQKNLLDRSLGVFPNLKVDVFSVSLSSKDIVLICTDGLTDALSDSDIQSILTTSSLGDAADQLIVTANEKGGFDNITVVLVQILET